MNEFIIITLSAVLVNNFVLAQFLGLCPFMGVSKKFDMALGMSCATVFVLTLSSLLSYLIYQYLLVPLQLEFLKTITFILAIAVIVQFSEMLIRKVSPLLHRVLGIFLPLITTNCAVLAVGLLNVANHRSLSESVYYGFAASIGFALVLLLFVGLRDKIEVANTPKLFQGAAILMITAGLMSISFMGFNGLTKHF